MVMVKSPDHRRRARSVALQALFAADIRENRPEFRREPTFEWLDDEEPVAENVMEFATRLSGGVFDNRPRLDGLIGHYAPAWPVSQLSLIDRNILRIALLELLHHPGTPKKTAINEAVELAKVFGSESSARFVNGVLGSVMASLESGEVSPQADLIEPVSEGR